MKPFAAVVLFSSILGVGAPALAQYSGSCSGCIFVIGVSNVTGQTSSQSTVNVVTTTVAGSYMIRWYADESTPCSSSPGGGVTFTFSWTDASAARTFTTSQLTPDTTNGPGKFLSGTIPLYAAVSTAISYSSNYTAACGPGPHFAYDIHVSVERTQ